ncbi:acyl-CoA dehydrogenase family protein [Rhabdothermincola sp.]|uniref:acyl-CoA dehydrogenase family protein n=1 Tax=Rhabdothermincola sp. TaxID=2820405 RepID=UPI002FDF3595
MTVTAAETDSYADLRRELRSWLDANWDPDLTVGEWWDRLGEAGWAAPTWPVEWYGRGLSRDEANVVSRELRDHGALAGPAGLGLLLAGPTIIAHGTDEQKRRYLPDIVKGRKMWCQLFSEPGAGSDLAGLQARAVRDGDEWVVNGQKVWTSGAQWAELGMLLARTDPDVPKHRGISYFAIEMDQPGMDVRPLREMTGRALFNEVFMTDCRVADDALIGGLNNGWAVANTTLANERAGLGAGGSGAAGGAVPGGKAGFLERRAGDFVSARRGGGGGGGGPIGGGDLMIELAKGCGVAGDPTIRQDLMRLYSMNEIARYTTLRMKAAKAAGRGPGPEANTAKLSMSRITRLSRDLGMRIVGAGGMLAGGDAPLNGMVTEMTLFAPAVSIYGGSDEIQKNIIGERVLGLPSEPRLDKDVPFRELTVGTQQAQQA